MGNIMVIRQIIWPQKGGDWGLVEFKTSRKIQRNCSLQLSTHTN